MSLPPLEQIRDDVARALREDLGPGDLTASLLPVDEIAEAQVVCRQRAVLAGQAWFTETFRQVDDQIELAWMLDDGGVMQPGDTVCRLQGPAASILSAERTALNFLQTLSGTATAVAGYMAQVKGTGVRLLDTRKTLPGLRLAQKYAVTQGGGDNHRMGLYDAILVKENHIAAAGSIAAIVEQARLLHPGVSIEVEVESLDELRQALACGVERVLLDNFGIDRLREAVAINAGQARLEASGGVTLDNLRMIASTGVDDISIGALTKDLQSVDFSLLFTIH